MTAHNRCWQHHQRCTGSGRIAVPSIGSPCTLCTDHGPPPCKCLRNHLKQTRQRRRNLASIRSVGTSYHLCTSCSLLPAALCTSLRSRSSDYHPHQPNRRHILQFCNLPHFHSGYIAHGRPEGTEPRNRSSQGHLHRTSGLCTSS